MDGWMDGWMDVCIGGCGEVNAVSGGIGPRERGGDDMLDPRAPNALPALCSLLTQSVLLCTRYEILECGAPHDKDLYLQNVFHATVDERNIAPLQYD